MNIIHNEDALVTMMRPELKNKVNIVLTSPPYNTGRPKSSDPYHKRYDVHVDSMSNDEYIKWTLDIFKGYDRILKKNGVVLYNMSYGSENLDLLWLLLADIVKYSNFRIADCITWKKKHAIPNNISKNKLTRIVEYVFVLARKDEITTFDVNKPVVGVIEKTGQKNYANIQNFIEAKNNDGSNDINKATFSVDLVSKLLKIYGKPNSLVYDSFMGTGTTAMGALESNMQFIGSEISLDQCNYANKRITKFLSIKNSSESWFSFD